ncbi:uncharacterized protein [Montipora capricornis]|uniref:uncharacterized protein n=1 Tax=Montipora capricornis TaxID=246305 RepID=UPI0035F1AF62
MTGFCENDPNSIQNYSGIEPEQKSYSKSFVQVENGGSASLQETGVPEGFPADNMSIGSSNDDSVAAAAVFRHLDNLIRQQLDEEVDSLKSSVHRILSEQQQEFAKAFGLYEESTSSQASTSHVVPQSHNFDDTSSDDCQLLMQNSSDCEAAMATQYDYEGNICLNCRSELTGTITSQEEEQSIKMDEDMIVMNYLMRLMIASSEIANVLKRNEFRT